jgi:peptidyl-tRNA hydrolase
MKLYIVTRSNLPAGARAAQSCHALRAFSEKHPEIDRLWYKTSNNLVVLEAPDEQSLYALHLRARTQGIPHAVFREPDFDNAITALALSPEARKLVSNLPLALRDAA